MSTTMVPQVDRQHVGQALRMMRREYQHSQRELNALNRAALELEASAWVWDGETLVIQSASNLHKRYHVGWDGCDCQAGAHGKACKHLGAFHLLRRAAELALEPVKLQRQSRDEYEANLAEWNSDLF